MTAEPAITTIELDARDLEPPEPMQQALAALAVLKPGEQLRMLLHREPFPLYAMLRERGFTFVDVKPRISRDRAKKTIDLVFDIGEGPRVYIERIDIVGNTRTQDKVIRREMRVAEGDAFNAALLRRSRQRRAIAGALHLVDFVTLKIARRRGTVGRLEDRF